MSDLQILVDTTEQLTVHSPTNVFTLGNLAGIVLVSIVALLIYLKPAPGTSTRLLGPYLVCLVSVAGAIFLLTSIWSHTVTLNRASNDVEIRDCFAGIPYSTRHYPLDRMREAIMQYARPGTRIALVMDSGLVVQPLGKAYNPKPSQYKVMNLMNDFVHGIRPGGSRPEQLPSALSGHLLELRREIEKTQRENAEALRRAGNKTQK